MTQIKWIRAASVIMALVIAVGFATGNKALADVTAVEALPTRVTLGANTPSTVTFTWRVTYTVDPDPTGGMVPVTATITSVPGDFIIGGQVIGNGVLAFSRPVAALPGTSTPFIFAETLTVDRLMAVQIARGGPASYRRIFDDTDGAAVGALALVPQSGLAGPLVLTRIELLFPAGERTKIVKRDEQTHVEAVISFRGTGVGRFHWQLAGPIPAGGQPAFRTLSVVNRPLSGTGRTVVKSPNLATAQPGRYVVRLIPLDGPPGLTPPEIRYFVLTAPAGVAGGGATVALVQPATGAGLGADTRFSWQPVAGAAAYRLEFYGARVRVEGGTSETMGDPLGVDEEAGPLLAGVAVVGSDVEASLRDFTLGRLQGIGAAFWRVRAFDARGRDIGRSPLRRINLEQTSGGG